MCSMQKLLKVFSNGTAAKSGITKKERNTINHFKKVSSPLFQKQMS